MDKYSAQLNTYDAELVLRLPKVFTRLQSLEIQGGHRSTQYTPEAEGWNSLERIVDSGIGDVELKLLGLLTFKRLTSVEILETDTGTRTDVTT